MSSQIQLRLGMLLLLLGQLALPYKCTVRAVQPEHVDMTAGTTHFA